MFESEIYYREHLSIADIHYLASALKRQRQYFSLLQCLKLELPDEVQKFIVQLNRAGSCYRKAAAYSWIFRFQSPVMQFVGRNLSSPRLVCYVQGVLRKFRIVRLGNCLATRLINPLLTRPKLQKYLETAGTQLCKNSTRAVIRKNSFVRGH